MNVGFIEVDQERVGAGDSLSKGVHVGKICLAMEWIRLCKKLLGFLPRQPKSVQPTAHGLHTHRHLERFADQISQPFGCPSHPTSGAFGDRNGLRYALSRRLGRKVNQVADDVADRRKRGFRAPVRL